MVGPTSTASDGQVFWRSVALVGVAELFDKTWFMGLLLALRYSPHVVFIGSYLALFLHCFFAAAFGLAFARLIPQSVLNFLAAGLFAFFAALYAKDWYQADPDADAIAAGKEEAAEDCGFDATKSDVHTQSQEMAAVVGNAADDLEREDTSSAVVAQERAPDRNAGICSPDGKVALSKSFMGVFIAEWGDRTQIAMIGQHASQPLMPVFFGGAVAFFLLTLSAVGLASIAGSLKLSEKTVHLIGAVSFGVFAVLALIDSLTALDTQH